MVGKWGRGKKSIGYRYSYIHMKIKRTIIIIAVFIYAMDHVVIAGIHNFLFLLAILLSTGYSIGCSSLLV